MLVYFAHPYTSCEQGAVERNNGLIRRFIPKGKQIDSYSDEQISKIKIWCNSLPRKLLGYRTPDDLFENELDWIYSYVAWRSIQLSMFNLLLQFAMTFSLTSFEYFDIKNCTPKIGFYNKCWGDTTTVSLPTLFFCKKISIQGSHTLQ